MNLQCSGLVALVILCLSCTVTESATSTAAMMSTMADTTPMATDMTTAMPTAMSCDCSCSSTLELVVNMTYDARCNGSLLCWNMQAYNSTQAMSMGCTTTTDCMAMTNYTDYLATNGNGDLTCNGTMLCGMFNSMCTSTSIATSMMSDTTAMSSDSSTTQANNNNLGATMSTVVAGTSDSTYQSTDTMTTVVVSNAETNAATTVSSGTTMAGTMVATDTTVAATTVPVDTTPVVNSNIDSTVAIVSSTVASSSDTTATAGATTIAATTVSVTTVATADATTALPAIVPAVTEGSTLPTVSAANVADIAANVTAELVPSEVSSISDSLFSAADSATMQSFVTMYRNMAEDGRYVLLPKIQLIESVAVTANCDIHASACALLSATFWAGLTNTEAECILKNALCIATHDLFDSERKRAALERSIKVFDDATLATNAAFFTKLEEYNSYYALYTYSDWESIFNNTANITALDGDTTFETQFTFDNSTIDMLDILTTYSPSYFSFATGAAFASAISSISATALEAMPVTQLDKLDDAGALAFLEKTGSAATALAAPPSAITATTVKPNKAAMAVTQKLLSGSTNMTVAIATTLIQNDGLTINDVNSIGTAIICQVPMSNFAYVSNINVLRRVKESCAVANLWGAITSSTTFTDMSPFFVAFTDTELGYLAKTDITNICNAGLGSSKLKVIGASMDTYISSNPSQITTQASIEAFSCILPYLSVTSTLNTITTTGTNLLRITCYAIACVEMPDRPFSEFAALLDLCMTTSVAPSLRTMACPSNDFGKTLISAITTTTLGRFSYSDLFAAASVLEKKIARCDARAELLSLLVADSSFSLATDYATVGTLCTDFSTAQFSSITNANKCSLTSTIATAFSTQNSVVTASGLTYSSTYCIGPSTAKDTCVTNYVAACTASSGKKRKRRTVTTKTCADVRALGQYISVAMTAAELGTLTSTEFSLCVDVFTAGNSSIFTQAQAEQIVALALSYWGKTVAQLTSQDLALLGGSMFGFSTTQIADLTITSLETVFTLGNVISWSSEQVTSVYSRIKTSYLSNNLSMVDTILLALMQKVSVGIPEGDISSISVSSYCGAASFIGSQTGYAAAQVNQWATHATDSSCFGSSVSSWPNSYVTSLGTALGGLSATDFASLTQTQINSIAPFVIAEIPTTRFPSFTTTQIGYLSDTQIAQITTNQYSASSETLRQSIYDRMSSSSDIIIDTSSYPNPSDTGGDSGAGFVEASVMLVFTSILAATMKL